MLTAVPGYPNWLPKSTVAASW